jgi:hypothetical protein
LPKILLLIKTLLMPLPQNRAEAHMLLVLVQSGDGKQAASLCCRGPEPHSATIAPWLGMWK